MTTPLILVSHDLCPYVQRAVIVAAEKGMSYRRVDVDLARKPDWFVALSPTGKVPLLRVGDAVLFESAVICEYLDEVSPGSLHPADPLERARHRAWSELASALLSDIAGLYGTTDQTGFDIRRDAIGAKLCRLERVVVATPYFAGETFHMVDAAFGPVFRYFDTFELHVELGVFDRAPKVAAWRRALSARASIAEAVTQDYAQRLETFLRARGSHLSRLMA